MIKKVFTTLLLGVLMAAPTWAARANTYPDALAKTGKNPIVVFIPITRNRELESPPFVLSLT